MPDREREYVDNARVLDVKRKAHLLPDEVLVKLRKDDGSKPWWQLFKLAEFKSKVRHVAVPA